LKVRSSKDKRGHLSFNNHAPHESISQMSRRATDRRENSVNALLYEVGDVFSNKFYPKELRFISDITTKKLEINY